MFTLLYFKLCSCVFWNFRDDDKSIVKEDVILSEVAIDAEWKRIQKKTFTRWCNEHLKKQGPEFCINELSNDFSDGIRLIVLLEVLSQKKVGRYSKKPRVHAQRMENIEMALDFIMKKENIYLVNIGKTNLSKIVILSSVISRFVRCLPHLYSRLQ